MRNFEDQDERSFPIRVYGKAELATLYCPNDCITNALDNFSRWIRRNDPLMQELQGVGYNKYRRSFTPREVKIIVKYMGEPGG